MRCHDGEQVEASMASERLGPRESVARRARQGFQLCIRTPDGGSRGPGLLTPKVFGLLSGARPAICCHDDATDSRVKGHCHGQTTGLYSVAVDSAVKCPVRCQIACKF